MNIMFWLIIIIALFLLWLLLMPLWKSIGKAIMEIFQEAKDEIDGKYEEKEDDSNEKWS